MRWPWTNNGDGSRDKDTIDIILEQNRQLRNELTGMTEKVKEFETIAEGVETYKRTDEMLREWLNQSLTARANDKKLAELESKDKEDLIKENKQLKATIKSYQNRLKTYTSGLTKNRFGVIDNINETIDKFLETEDAMFIKYVKGPLDKAGYYEKLATKHSITLDKTAEELTKLLVDANSVNDMYLEIIKRCIPESISNIAEELYSRAMYKPFVRRSISMNNRTKEIFQEIKDKLMLLSDQHSEELIELRLENSKLKQEIISITEKDDKAARIQQLEREINNLKIENEALRYK